MKTAILNIVRMPLADVNHPHPKNPRDIPPDDSEEIRVLDASLAHDYFDPVVWNRRNGLLVSGHVRVPRLLALGFTHADVSVVDYDDATHEARLLAGNDHSGKNNDDKLDALLTSLRTSAVDPVLALLAALPDDIAPGEFPMLKSGDREPFQQVTFTLHDSQIETLKAALTAAKQAGGSKSDHNENSNGNALAFIAASYLREAAQD